MKQNYLGKTKKKSKGKVIIALISGVLIMSLMLGVAGYFRKDIMELINPILGPSVESPIVDESIDNPIVDLPIVDEPVVVPVEEDDPVVIVPVPEPILLNVGDSIESIYFNIDIFDEVVKANLATLDIDNNPDYSGIGYKFLSVDLLVDDNTFEYQFVICPFVRLYDILGFDVVPSNVSNSDYFILIYCPDLTDWFFDECFYSSVSASIVIPPDEESEGLILSFLRGFRRDGFDEDGKLMFEQIVNRNVTSVYGEDIVYEIGNVNFIDDIIAPSFVSVNDVKFEKREMVFQPYTAGNMVINADNDLAIRSLMNTIEPDFADFAWLGYFSSYDFDMLNGTLIAEVDINFIDPVTGDIYISKNYPLSICKISDYFAVQQSKGYYSDRTLMSITDDDLAVFSDIEVCYDMPDDAYCVGIDTGPLFFSDNSVAVSVGNMTVIALHEDFYYNNGFCSNFIRYSFQGTDGVTVPCDYHSVTVINIFNYELFDLIFKIIPIGE